jgi:hypothetical protein
MELTTERIGQIQRLLWEEKYIIPNPIKGKGSCHIIKNKRFGSWIFKGNESKNALKQFLAFNKEYRCIAQIQDINGYRQFIPFRSWKNCWDSYQFCCYDKRYFNEIILSDNPCKPYLDIEWKILNEEKQDYESFIKKLKVDLKTVFKNRYKIDLLEKHILIATAHGENKASFHIIINCIIDGEYIAYQTNRAKEANSAWDLYRALVEHDNKYIPVIDESVYSLDREFRAIYSTKFKEYRQLKPEGQKDKGFCDNYLDYLITYFKEGITIKCLETPVFINPKINKIIRHTTLSGIKGHHVVDRLVNGDDKEIINRTYELLQFIHPTAHFTNRTTDGGWRFSYSDKTEVCYMGHIHKSNGFNVYVRPTNGDVMIYCLSKRCGKLFKLGNLHFDTLWKKEAMNINQQYLDYKTEIL